MLEPNNTFAELYECPLKMLFIEHILVLVLALIHVRHTKLLLFQTLYIFIFIEREQWPTLYCFYYFIKRELLLLYFLRAVANTF